MHKAEEIDTKLKWLFQTYKSDVTRRTNKKHNRANFMYLRIDDQIIILKSKGDTPSTITNKFHAFTDTPLHLKIGDFTYVKVFVKDKEVYVTLSKETYRYMRYKLDPYFPVKAKSEIVKIWKIFDKLPNVKGILQQKQQMLDYIMQNCRRHGIKIELEIKKQSNYKIPPLTQIP